MALGEQAQTLALAQQLVPNYLDQKLKRELAAAQIGGIQANSRFQDFQVRAGEAELDDDRAYRAAILDPRAQTLEGKLEILRRFPKQAKANFDALKFEVGEKDKAAFTRAGEAANLAAAGRWDRVAEKLKEQIAADRAASQDTADDEELLAMVESGDPEKRRMAAEFMGRSAAMLAGPEHASSLLNALDPTAGSYTLDNVRFDRNNKPIAEVPKYVNLVPGGKAAPLPSVMGGAGPSPTISNPAEGGDQASGATGATASPPSGSPRRRLGWTPRARDGGDNSDAVVDSKIAQISQATGFHPDAPLSLEQAQRVIAAIPATEGGPNDLPAKLNNPGAIIDGAYARKQPGYAGAQNGYARFKSREQGMAAAHKLGQVYYNRGQRSIRDIIEGKPVGGGSTPVQAAQAAPPSQANRAGDAPGTIYGDPEPTYRPISLAEAKARGLPTDRQFQISPDGKVEEVSGTGPSERPDKQFRSEGDLRKEFIGRPDVKAFFDMRQAHGRVRSLTQGKDAAKLTPQDDIALVFNFMKLLDPGSVVRESEFATAQNAAGVPDRIRNLYNSVREGVRLTPQQRAQMVRNVDELYRGARDQYNQVAREYRKLAESYGFDAGRVALIAEEGKNSGPVRVRSVQEAQKLPAGTMFVAPNGKTYRKR